MKTVALLVVLTGCLGPSVYVESAGDGHGRIVSDPVGIDCGDTCAMVLPGTLTLTATPDEASTFIGWQGDCEGTDICTIAGDQDGHVSALFESKFYPLTVTRTGNGTITGPGIDCGEDCEQVLRHGAHVLAIATPAPEWSLISLTGPRCKGDACELDITNSTEIAAVFAPNSNLAITIAGLNDGRGTVTASSSASTNNFLSSCGPAVGTCTTSLSPVTTVTLTAVPEGDSTFVGWSGACSGKLPCVVSMDAARTVTASFSRPVQALLTVELAGTAASLAIVRSMYLGPIFCPGDCSETVWSDMPITLWAIPGQGSTFVGWTGTNGECGTELSCTPTLTSALTVTAHFELN